MYLNYQTVIHLKYSLKRVLPIFLVDSQRVFHYFNFKRYVFIQFAVHVDGIIAVGENFDFFRRGVVSLREGEQFAFFQFYEGAYEFETLNVVYCHEIESAVARIGDRAYRDASAVCAAVCYAGDKRAVTFSFSEKLRVEMRRFYVCYSFN